jgi:CheY-like chemotaxis protein
MPNCTHIALAEDNEEMRYMCRWILKDAFPDADLIEFENGLAAWEYLQTHSADILVTDHGMPHMDGADLTRRLRAHGHQMPVIMISSSVVNIKEAFQAGVNEFLEKDHLLTRLPPAIERFLPRCDHADEGHQRV